MSTFSVSGDGWFEDNLGVSATEIVSRLRKARRHNKDEKHDIDALIQDVRMLKAMEVEMTLNSVDWANEYLNEIRNFDLSDKSLKSLRKFYDSRKVGLVKACLMWRNADETLKMLNEHEEVWGDEERKSWVDAMSMKKDARKMWKSTLSQMDRLTEKEQETISKCVNLLKMNGPMSARALFESDKIEKMPGLTANKLSKLLSLYGEEVDIVSGAQRGTFVKMDKHGLVLKDPYAYAAGFLDADGYITITKRGEPRAGFIATGTRGRIHCEELRKVLDCGVLQLDQKVYKDSQRSQHRLQFYSKSDIKKLLDKIMPHLQMKKTQAKAVLAFIEEPDSMRKEELKRVVRYSNWSDDKAKSQTLLAEWGVSADDVAKWQEGL
jgi:hypothetical protein|tara:strand:+ start:5252 stop:6388 length:1137 start_codon:yes stop_codon:yes gene_type:complete